jgi:predicted transcriptional regulator
MIKTYPVYSNKYYFYMTSVKPCDFSWFICAKPYKDDKGNDVVCVDPYSSFFDYVSGKTYHVKFDVVEDKKCILKIVTSKKEFNSALSEGYNGVAIMKKDKKCKSQDLVCSQVQMIFEPNVLEESTLCPFINYAKTHSFILRKEISNFPTRKELKNAKPGKISLKLREMLK